REAGVVAVAGVCGALIDGLSPGDIVVANEVRDPDGHAVRCSSGPLAASLRAMGFDVTVGPIASWPSLASGAEREALAATGAVAVDMESAWLAPVAGERPFAVLRVVVDTPSQGLGKVVSTVTPGTSALRQLRPAAPALDGWARAAGPRTVLLAGPRSFCAGVERAIEIVERALD